MNRFDKEVSINSLPKPSLPRTIYDHKALKHFTTATHGRVTPFCCYPVKPNDTFSIDTALFVKMDIANEVPLDDVQCVVEYYYAPLRILADDFKLVLGDKDYDDTNTYSFPKTKIKLGHATPVNNDWNDERIAGFLLPRLGYGIARRSDLTKGTEISISSMPLVMYAKIWNHNYRDTLLQKQVPFENLVNNTTAINIGSADNGAAVGLYDFFLGGLKINRTHDFFADGYISPNLEGDISINLGNPIRIDTESSGHSIGTTSGAPLRVGAGGTGFSTNNNVKIKSTGELNTTSAATGNDVWGTNLIAPTDQLTINQLLMAFSLYQYQFKTQTYGTHYDDWLYAHFGLEVSMSLIDEPECLASTMTTLNMMPVLNQGTQTDLGKANGLSNTFMKGASFTKSFVEHGYIIGVMSFRINAHTYGQGYNPHVWDLENDLDLVTPEFLNIGRVVNPMTAIFNDPDTYGTNKGVFNYINAYDEFRKYVNRTSGLFAPIELGGAYDNFIKYWTYQDIYSSAPTFSSLWLEEDPDNVKRTLSGKLIPNAPDIGKVSQQYIVEVAQNIKVAQVMPAEPVPAHLVQRLK